MAFGSAAACARGNRDRLVVAHPVGLVSIDVTDPAQEEYSVSILSNVYEALVDVQPDLSLAPGLAEAWHNPDELTWVFTLRDDVRFHDGRLMTAADVVASVERSRRNPWMRGELQAVSSVAARGEREVVFRTRTPFDALPERLTYLYVTGPPLGDGVPVAGTGPYRIRSWQKNGTTVLEAVPGHRDGPVGIPVVEFRTVPDARDRARLLTQGVVHLTSNLLPSVLGTPLPHALRVVAVPGLRVVFVGMGCLAPPFSDRRLREAVALAVDREALVSGPLEGYAEPVYQMPGPSDLGFDAALPRRKSDPGRAAALVGAAAPGGVDVTLDYMAGKSLALDAVVQAIAGQLARIGIRATPRPSTPAEFMARTEARSMPLYVMGWINDTGAAHEMYVSLLHSPTGVEGAINGGGYSNAAFDRILDFVPREADRSTRTGMLQRATRILDEDIPVVPVYRQRSVYAFDARLDFEPQLYPRIRVGRIHWKQ